MHSSYFIIAAYIIDYCTAAASLVSCSVLYGAAVSGLILGVVTFLMSFLCCCHFCTLKNVILCDAVVVWAVLPLLLLLVSYFKNK